MDYFVIRNHPFHIIWWNANRRIDYSMFSSPNRAYPHQDRGILPPSRLHYGTVYHTKSSSGALHANTAKRGSNAPRAYR
jgi:hypothetical protein